MSKLRSFIPPPRRASRTVLPAAVTASLLALLALQFGLPRAVMLPLPAAIRPLKLAPLALGPSRALPEMTAHPLFATLRGAASPTGVGATADQPLDGARAAGVVTRRGAALAFVQAPGGTIVALAPGQAYHGWRLVRIDAAALTFRRGAATATLPFGASVATRAGESR